MREKSTLSEQLDDVYRYVLARIAKLQGMYLSETTRGKAAQQFAVLRHAATKGPGSDPDVWAIEFDGMPESLIGSGQDASTGERAVHIALTLYAVHQQSQGQEMCRTGKKYDIGAAVRRYVYLSKGTEGLQDGELPRRFAAMSTADSLDELAHHARQLIHLLRANSLPVDYGRLARQLLAFQIPSMRDGVRLEWGRAYAQTKLASDDETLVNAQVKE